MTDFVFKITNDLRWIECLSAPSDVDYYNMVANFRKKRDGAWKEEAVKMGLSDGCTPFFVDNKLPIGLWGELANYCKLMGFSLYIYGMDSFINMNLTLEEITEFCNKLFEGTEITNIRWYQYESIYKLIKFRYSSQQISTAAGKTMISYAVASYLKSIEKVNKDKKLLLVVPNVDLVGQTYDKFVRYNNGFVGLNVMPMGGKKYKYKKDLYDECDTIVANYQILNNMPDSFFEKVRVVNVDEAHTAKTESIKRIINLTMPLSWRFGFSGTLMIHTGYANYYHNLEQLGPVTFVYNPKDLIADGFAPEVKIKKVYIDYGDKQEFNEYKEYMRFRDERPEKGSSKEMEFFKDLYKIERDMITSDERRLKLLVDYVSKLKKNTLILFNDVKGSFGKRIAEELNKYKPTKYIDGNVDLLERKLYTDEIEEKDINLVASFGTFSTGIDLKNVHYIVFAESYKSPILIGQSIGRGLRNHKSKKFITIIDFVDSLYKHTNKQYKEREELYKAQKYPIDIETLKL